jgi:hypothetical protein
LKRERTSRAKGRHPATTSGHPCEFLAGLN